MTSRDPKKVKLVTQISQKQLQVLFINNRYHY